MNKKEQDAYRDWLQGGRIASRCYSTLMQKLMLNLSVRSRKAIGCLCLVKGRAVTFGDLVSGTTFPAKRGTVKEVGLADMPEFGPSGLREVDEKLQELFGQRLHDNHTRPRL